ncbi:MAG: hypothetical protein HC831_27520 [Chloroflexia bacterium]|nr:hypothetical protein [Chloroflexia bacterium]
MIFDKGINYLKENGEHRVIDYDGLSVGERSDFVDGETQFLYTQTYMWDGLVGIDRSPKKVETKHSVFVLTEIINGKPFYYYSPEIDKDSATLGFLLEREGKIHLYIDKKNHCCPR